MVGCTVPIIPSISAIKTKPVTMQRCTTVHMSGFRGGYPHVYTVASVIGSAFLSRDSDNFWDSVCGWIIFGTVCVCVAGWHWEAGLRSQGGSRLIRQVHNLHILYYKTKFYPKPLGIPT